MNVEHIIDMARQAGASDVHLVCGLPVKYRLACASTCSASKAM